MPGPVWVALGGGFVGRPLWEPGWRPSRRPIARSTGLLVAAFAAYSGAGGTINAMLTYWLRDKGFGMAGTVGVAADAGGRPEPPAAARRARSSRPARPTSPSGASGGATSARISPLSGRPGCLIGMALPVLLALDAVPRGHRHGRPRRGRGVRARAGAALLGAALDARAADRALDLLLDPGRDRGGLRAQRDRDAVDGGRAARDARARAGSTTRCSRSSCWRGASP